MRGSVSGEDEGNDRSRQGEGPGRLQCLAIRGVGTSLPASDAMKICVLGLDCAAPEIIFHDERLQNIRRLMSSGVYGRLESVIPPITVPAWMCMATSQDPGSLGVYGFRNRSDYSYGELSFVNSASIQEPALWDYLGREGKKSIVVGVPPGYPPRRLQGISIGCFMTPDSSKDEFTHPAAFKARITALVSEYPVAVKVFRPDEQIGSAVHSLDRETIVLLVSDHGAQRLDGGFAVNEWLIGEGLLVVDDFPKQVTPFDKLRINWARTKVWSEGGYYARVFFNVQGREPKGIIPASDYQAFQDEMKAKFEALTDDKGRPLNSPVFKPKEIYHHVRNVAPDLIVHFGGLYWRSIGSVGHGRFHVQENDTGPDACNHAQFGMFVLVAPNCPLRGEYHGARLL